MRQQTAAIIGGGIATAALVAIIVAVGASPGTTCAASLSLPTLSVVVAGDPRAVTAVELCTSAACSFADGPTASPAPIAPTQTGPTQTGPSGTGPTGTSSPDTPSPAAPGASAPVFLQQSDSRTWGIAEPGDKPAMARVLVRGTGGTTLVEKTFTLHWRQVGETTPCGNIQTTKPLRLVLPIP